MTAAKPSPYFRGIGLCHAFLLALLVFSIQPGDAGADEACKDDCILRNASDDQECETEKTPLVRCSNFREFARRDAQLNAAYKALYARLNDHDREQLRQMQRQWITWRDETCDDAEAKATCTNGICLGVAHDSCIVRLTARRHDELTKFQADAARARANRFSFSRTPHGDDF